MRGSWWEVLTEVWLSLSDPLAILSVTSSSISSGTWSVLRLSTIAHPQWRDYASLQPHPHPHTTNIIILLYTFYLLIVVEVSSLPHVTCALGSLPPVLCWGGTLLKVSHTYLGPLPASGPVMLHQRGVKCATCSVSQWPQTKTHLSKTYTQTLDLFEWTNSITILCWSSVSVNTWCFDQPLCYIFRLCWSHQLNNTTSRTFVFWS